uniref:Uncharacterized protein n=1 Tax=Anguilla anguilla TaxID=7936 RepID=A0A0E9XU21_ANGAN
MWVIINIGKYRYLIV